ncbi:MAG TPA: response regulator transcription factor [Cellvibrionaceae bacterium]|nr:response regulator transcription factor [Cellvibrionaceae bacterium]HMW73316.1 response regulator transcription factor [Cellvibrionaceae bacterium]HNG61980.1 response regulator transcription factor [Cellvibrionaceae bacterium]
MTTQEHILVVEDDTSLAEWICDYLGQHNYKVSLATTGTLAVERIACERPDLVVLDLMLPEKNGFDVCKEVRQFFAKPILMMTASGDEVDEVLGLELGADDYITKPVKPRVLLARIKALLRREPATGSDSSRSFGRLLIDAQSKSVSLAGNPLDISSHEFDVLWLLACRAGEVVSRTELVSQLRGIEYDGFDRSVDIRISRLRKKLGDSAEAPSKIKTVWGRGYLFAPDAW